VLNFNPSASAQLSPIRRPMAVLRSKEARPRSTLPTTQTSARPLAFSARHRAASSPSRSAIARAAGA
jgi:hypothetical protein